MMLAEAVREVFLGYRFGPRCGPGEFDEAEWTLGHALPPVLRELYSAFDGFEGPTSTSFFYPLIRRRPFSPTTLVEQTLTLRLGEESPTFFRRALAIGDDGCGTTWGILLDEPWAVFEWHGSDGEDYEPVGPCPLDAWRESRRLYHDLDPGA